ncbi:MAG: hypothetical protein A3G41_00895 [Elusimicrobia bacterium RIFCSPLOWO2_12_FULL_59_9]|nr:MAG: hypothetical protein A3G41_00895 [Elusimicrobia bacterium RIFCSPLOWO2_12_FULL_59_9]
MKNALALAGCLFLAGCVPLTQEDLSQSSGVITSYQYPELDAGGHEQQGLHFIVKGYDLERIKAVTELVEGFYNRIMQDTGLYSFKPAGLYPIILYASREEYLKKTRQPEWSRGLSMGNAIFTYDGDHLRGVLAHEITHLIFHEYMGGASGELRWVNEGLAVYEEIQAENSPEVLRAWRGAVKAAYQNVIPFQDMVILIPASEKERTVNTWYAQVGSVVSFMVETGGRFSFSIFLKELRRGQPLPQALQDGFAGKWRNLSDLEYGWHSTFHSLGGPNGAAEER